MITAMSSAVCLDHSMSPCAFAAFLCVGRLDRWMTHEPVVLDNVAVIACQAVIVGESYSQAMPFQLIVSPGLTLDAAGLLGDIRLTSVSCIGNSVADLACYRDGICYLYVGGVGILVGDVWDFGIYALPTLCTGAGRVSIAQS